MGMQKFTISNFLEIFLFLCNNFVHSFKMSNPISYMYFTWLDEIDAANDEYHSLIMNDICNVVASMASESSNQPTEDGDGDGEENEDEDGEEDEDGDEDGEEDENEYEDEDMALVDEYWMQQVVHATMTSIKELEKVRIESFDLCDNCTICLEKFSTQLELCRMSCSHVFHEDCITHWLETSHFCPLCRFKMPVDPS